MFDVLALDQEGARPGEVSAVMLQQALADLDAAYRTSSPASGQAGDAKAGRSGFRSRKDHRQAIRLTANAWFEVLTSRKLRLPKTRGQHAWRAR